MSASEEGVSCDSALVWYGKM